MKNKLESILLEIIKEYMNDHRKDLFDFPSSTLGKIADVIESFKLKCAIGLFGGCDENN